MTKLKKIASGISSDQVEKLILLILVCIAVAGVVTLAIKDAHRRSYLETLRIKNLNAPVEHDNN